MATIRASSSRPPMRFPSSSFRFLICAFLFSGAVLVALNTLYFHLLTYDRNVVPSPTNTSSPFLQPEPASSLPTSDDHSRILSGYSNYPPQPSQPSRTRVVRRSHRRLARSKLFAARVNEFFVPSCKPRFFMTWITVSRNPGPRELLSMQSVFKTHRHACLLVITNPLDSTPADEFLEPLKGLPVAAIRPDMAFLLQGTPGWNWYKELSQGYMDTGAVPLEQNLSNLLRYALLYRFGGIYIDTDVLVLKNMSGLRNTIGAQSWTLLNNAVLIFDRGHPILYHFIEEFARTFDGNRWGFNGPDLVTRVTVREMDLHINVLLPAAFYPVDWNGIERLFGRPREGDDLELQVERIRRESFALHLWNKETMALQVEKGSVIERIMLDCCLRCNSSVLLKL